MLSSSKKIQASVFSVAGCELVRLLLHEPGDGRSLGVDGVVEAAVEPWGDPGPHRRDRRRGTAAGAWAPRLARWPGAASQVAPSRRAVMVTAPAW